MKQEANRVISAALLPSTRTFNHNEGERWNLN